MSRNFTYCLFQPRPVGTSLPLESCCQVYLKGELMRNSRRYKDCASNKSDIITIDLGKENVFPLENKLIYHTYIVIKIFFIVLCCIDYRHKRYKNRQIKLGKLINSMYFLLKHIVDEKFWKMLLK